MRYISVTGVQTCALPICVGPKEMSSVARNERPSSTGRALTSTSSASRSRSEERRVGEECRSRWAAYEIYQCDWSSDVCSSDLRRAEGDEQRREERAALVDRARVDFDVLREQELEQLVVLGERRGGGLEVRRGPP